MGKSVLSFVVLPMKTKQGSQNEQSWELSLLNSHVRKLLRWQEVSCSVANRQACIDVLATLGLLYVNRKNICSCL